MNQDPTKTEGSTERAEDELQVDELEQVTGGAAYLKFDGIKGEATQSDHKEWIDILSVSASSPTRQR